MWKSLQILLLVQLAAASAYPTEDLLAKYRESIRLKTGSALQRLLDNLSECVTTRNRPLRRGPLFRRTMTSLEKALAIDEARDAGRHTVDMIGVGFGIGKRRKKRFTASTY